MWVGCSGCLPDGARFACSRRRNIKLLGQRRQVQLRRARRRIKPHARGKVQASWSTRGLPLPDTSPAHLKTQSCNISNGFPPVAALRAGRPPRHPPTRRLRGWWRSIKQRRNAQNLFQSPSNSSTSSTAHRARTASPPSAHSIPNVRAAASMLPACKHCTFAACTLPSAVVAAGSQPCAPDLCPHLLTSTALCPTSPAAGTLCNHEHQAHHPDRGGLCCG